jgi:hypothetical protein
LHGQGFKLIALLIAIPIFVIGGAVYRERRGKELSNAEGNDIFNKAYAAAVVVIIFIFGVLFYVNNQPW